MSKTENPSMKKIRTKDLVDGMRFTHTVFIDKKNIFVAANVPVKQRDVERLLNWGILELETAGDLIRDDKESQAETGSYQVDALNKMEAELKALVDNQIKKTITPPKAKETIKTDLSQRVTIADYHLSWIETCEAQIELARNNSLLDRGAANRVAREIIKISSSDPHELLLQLSKNHEGHYLAIHGTNVAVYSAIIGQRLNLNPTSLLNLVLGCYFIDIGMTMIPDNIINKEGSLTINELKKIHTHPVYGYQILVQQNGFPQESGSVLLEHHEWYNGTGYPRKLARDKISLFGRIAAIVDTYEAMTGNRSYREEYISHEAMKSMLAGGQSHFDNDLLAVFLKEVGVYPVGSKVLLNNNSIGLVLKADPDLPLRPKIKVIRDEFGDPIKKTTTLSLADESDLVIIEALRDQNDD